MVFLALCQMTPCFRKVPVKMATILKDMKSSLQQMFGWMAHHAWSRAGAIADVLNTQPVRRAITFTTRLGLFLVGTVLIAVPVATMLWNGLGPGPLDVFIGAIRLRTGLPLAVSVWVTVGGLTAAAWLLGRRPGVGTIVAPLLIGPVMQATLTTLSTIDAPSHVLVQFVVQVTSIVAVGFGAGALIVSGLGAGSGELLATAASDRSGASEPRVRMMIETMWIVTGVALGGPAGVGTVMFALGIGPAVELGFRSISTVGNRVRHRTALALA